MKDQGKIVIHFDYDSVDGLNIKSTLTNVEILMLGKPFLKEDQLASFALHLLPTVRKALEKEIDPVLKKEVNSAQVKKRIEHKVGNPKPLIPFNK